MKRKYLFQLLMVMALASSCQESEDLDQLGHMLSDYRFEILAIHYGGLVGECRVSYHFESHHDSMDVLVLTHCYTPDDQERIRIPKSAYDQVIEALYCFSRDHHDGTPTRSGCTPPFDKEYFIKRGFSSLRIFPTMDSNCSFESIIHAYSENGSNIDL